MNKEDLIVKYFTGNYAYNLYLMGLIFGNPIYSEYILNKEYFCDNSSNISVSLL